VARLRVADLIDPDSIAPDDGATICHQACAALNDGHDVLLDFAGVANPTAAFLISSVGCLFVRLPIETVAERFRWTGLDATDDETMRLVLGRAMRFSSATPDQQQALLAADDQ
jgi:hypothetical protein